MYYAKTVLATTDHGSFQFNFEADNKTIEQFKEGLSNWKGKVFINGFKVVFTDADGVLRESWAVTRKEAILNAVGEYCYGKFTGVFNPTKNLSFQLI